MQWIAKSTAPLRLATTDTGVIYQGEIMAFDMYLGSQNEKINYHEEEIFMILEKQSDFPNCEWLWEEFYNGPKIDGPRSKALAEELSVAKGLKSVKSNKALLDFIERVIPFFRKSYVSNKPIKCLSD